MILAAVEVEVEEYPKSNTMHTTAAARRGGPYKRRQATVA
jgi:hypothetical protein